MCFLDIAQTAVHGELFQPIWYVPFVGQYALLAGGGLIASRRGYDRFFAWYQLITLLAWALVVQKTSRRKCDNTLNGCFINRESFGLGFSLQSLPIHSAHENQRQPARRACIAGRLRSSDGDARGPLT